MYSNTTNWFFNDNLCVICTKLMWGPDVQRIYAITIPPTRYWIDSKWMVSGFVVVPCSLIVHHLLIRRHNVHVSSIVHWLTCFPHYNFVICISLEFHRIYLFRRFNQRISFTPHRLAIVTAWGKQCKLWIFSSFITSRTFRLILSLHPSSSSSSSKK